MCIKMLTHKSENVKAMKQYCVLILTRKLNNQNKTKKIDHFQIHLHSYVTEMTKVTPASTSVKMNFDSGSARTWTCGSLSN